MLEALVFFFSASLRQSLWERIVMVQVQQLQKREREAVIFPLGAGGEVLGLYWILNLLNKRSNSDIKQDNKAQ